ncbi:MAG: hypothetical protein U5L10_02860 [Candidatus Moranbacteria bacterium]|nr:hypothetical protein [Candidatus Moranbacteria bacterium]
MAYNVWKIFVSGIGILAVAMVVNFLADFLGLETWYSFIAKIREKGFGDVLKAKWQHLLFLFFVYPFVLGLAGYWTLRRFKE